MPMGYIYSCNNKYNLKKCIVILKKRNINYTIFDEYVVTQDMVAEFSSSKYYVELLRDNDTKKPLEVPVKKYKNNMIEKEIAVKFKISGCGCELKRGRIKYKLTLPNGKKHEFNKIKKSEYIFDKIFIDRDKDFFEFNFNQIYHEDINILDKAENDNKQRVDGYYYNEDAIFHEVEEEIVDFEDFERRKAKETFDFSKVFDDMTENQAKVLGLTLLKVSAKAISILMKTSSTYILLERGRIIKKIKKMIERGDLNGN